jgi:hypothetical protein
VRTIIYFARACFLLLLMSGIGVVPASAQASFSVNLERLPNGVVDEPYGVQLSARGGATPLFWQVSQGSLPPGLQLDAESGLLFGTPGATGTYRFVAAVTDSASPRALAKGEFTIEVRPALVMGWGAPPALESDTISGQLAVINNSNHPFETTVIVVAVNEIGKVFALGYRQLTMEPQSSLTVPFSSSLPFGSYTVDADTIATIPATDRVFRAHLETSAPMVISQP